MPLFETVTDLLDEADVVVRRPYGMIEAVDGQFHAIHLRPWPKWFSPAALPAVGNWFRAALGTDRCRLYYNQPRSCANFLALRYVVSSHGASLASFYRTLESLDVVAQIKGCDAIVCDAVNFRLSDRFLRRRGWEPHCPSHWHRHYIKRFYGNYPPLPGWLEPTVRLDRFRPISAVAADEHSQWLAGIPALDDPPPSASPCLTIYRGADDEMPV